MRFLKQTEGSVLWLLGSNAIAVGNLKKKAVVRVITSNRLMFTERVAPETYLVRLRLADFFLDTLSYSARTTTSDELCAGVPILT